MSWRRSIYTGYNRSEQKEKHHWVDLLFEEYYYEFYPDDNELDTYWMYYGIPGYCDTMGEYHQMKVLTLLRSLSIRYASVSADERGW